MSSLVSKITTEISFSYVRSSGPGGQNVNKVNSKTLLRWNVAESFALSPAQRSTLLEKLSSRLTAAGDLIIVSDRFRDQTRNREDCLEKLAQILSASLQKREKRVRTKPTRASKERRIQGKKLHAKTKKDRNWRD